MATARQVYRVTLDCPGGQAVLDVPSSFGSEPAERRAWWTAVAIGWGEPDQITVLAVEQLDPAVA